MSKPKVFITRRWTESVEAKLRDLYDVTLNETDRPLSAEEFKSALQNYDAVCPTVCDSFPADVLNAPTKRCKILANFGVGYNHIDIDAAEIGRHVGGTMHDNAVSRHRPPSLGITPKVHSQWRHGLDQRPSDPRIG